MIDITGELARLEELTLFELRAEWRRVHRIQPPKTLSRDLLMRGITYRIQERSLGGLSKSLLRKIGTASANDPVGGRRRPALPIAIKPGTRLIREWQGVTHTVLVQANGVEWQGRHYKSLSVVARAITGAHWSGPRFFGLRRRTSKDRVPVSERDHGQA